MLSRRQLGSLGESLAARYLERIGCRLLSRNHRILRGELDLVVQDGPEVVFVEVKTRVGGHLTAPEESVSASKVSQLVRLAEVYLREAGREDEMWRIDVVAVVVDRAGTLKRLEHFRNAVY